MLFDLEHSLEQLASATRQARLAYGWSVAELAERSGVATSTIKRFEKSGVITSDRLLLLMMPLGVADKLLAAAADRSHWTIEQHARLAEKQSRRRG